MKKQRQIKKAKDKQSLFPLIRLHLVSMIMLLFLFLFIYNKPTSSFSSIRSLLTSDKIKKPLTDEREYEIIKLDNKLVITLISDINTNRSGFSMSTLLGSINKMIRYPGLSKLLQIRFVSNSLINLIKKYTGHYHFVTNEETSSYYFDIDTKGLEKTLDEFSSMLNSKLDYYDNNNRDIVYDLNNIYKTQDAGLIQDILIDYIISEETSNYDNTFMNGGSIDKKAIVDNMKGLFDTYYTPEIIKIAIVSNLSITELKKICLKTLSKVKSKNVSVIPLISKDEDVEYQKIIWAKPRSKEENNLLKINIYTGDQMFKYSSILPYFVYMLEGERADSVYYYLGQHQYKYIEDISISIERSIKTGNHLVLNMKLTNEGIRDIQYIFKVVFGLFQSIKNSDQIERTYKDLQTIYKKKFQFMTIDKYHSYLNDITFRMLEENTFQMEEELSNILFWKYDLEEYNKNKIINYIDNYLNLEHSVIFIETNDIEISDKDTRSQFIGIQSFETRLGYTYKLAEINPNTFREEIDMFGESYMGKKENPYMTQLDSLSETFEEGVIRSIIKDSKMKFWAKRDTTFKVPRVHSYFRLVYPDVRNNDPDQYKLNMVYANVILEDFIKTFEEAKLSGNEIIMNIDENGINIKVSSYKDVYLAIINKIIDIIYNKKSVNKDWTFDYESKRYRSIEEKSLNYLGNVIKPDGNGNDNKQFRVHIDDYNVLDFFTYNSQHMYMEALIYGDIDEEMVSQMKRTLESINRSKESNEIESKYPNKKNMKDILEGLSYNTIIQIGNVHVFRMKDTFNREEEFTYIAFYQLGRRTNRLDIFSSLVCYMFNKGKYNESFTLEKVYKDNLIYLRVIKSSYNNTPKEIAMDFDNLVEIFIEEINNISKEALNEAFKYIQWEYNKKDIRLRHKAIKYWYEIYERTFDFNRYDTLLHDINNMNINDIYSEYKQFVYINLYEEIRKVEFWLYHNNYFDEIEDNNGRNIKTKIISYDNFYFIKE